MKRIVFATLFLLVSSTLAQNQTPPTTLQNLYLVTEVRVQQGMGQEYLELMKNEDTPALKKGGAKQRNAFTTSILGELGGYIFRTYAKRGA